MGSRMLIINFSIFLATLSIFFYYIPPIAQFIVDVAVVKYGLHRESTKSTRKLTSSLKNIMLLPAVVMTVEMFHHMIEGPLPETFFFGLYIIVGAINLYLLYMAWRHYRAILAEYRT